MKSTVIFVISLLMAFGLMHAADAKGYDIVVAQDGSGDFTTIQEAVNSVPDFRKKRAPPSSSRKVSTRKNSSSPRAR